MPRAAPAVCPRCRRVYVGKRCKCTPMWQGSHSPPGTHQWRKLRSAKLDANPRCETCRQRPATEVDHVIPLAERPDLRYDWDNLSSICRDCHRAKTAEESRRGKDMLR